MEPPVGIESTTFSSRVKSCFVIGVRARLLGACHRVSLRTSALKARTHVPNAARASPTSDQRRSPFQSARLTGPKVPRTSCTVGDARLRVWAAEVATDY